MSEPLTVEQPKPKAKPVPASALFIFIGDPKDNGAGNRAPSDDDDGPFLGSKVYGFTFPKGKAVPVPLNAKIGNTPMLVVEKLRGNSHFFEGTEAEFKAARDEGEIVFTKAPKKVPVRTQDVGVRGLEQPAGIKPSADDGDDD